MMTARHGSTSASTAMRRVRKATGLQPRPDQEPHTLACHLDMLVVGCDGPENARARTQVQGRPGAIQCGESGEICSLFPECSAALVIDAAVSEATDCGIS